MKQVRRALKYTQAQLASHLNVTQQQIQRYESDKDNPSIEALVKMSRLFGVSLEYLVLDTDEDLQLRDAEAAYLIERLLSLKYKGKQFAVKKLIQMVLFFATICDINKTKLNKLLFYADFIHFKDHGTAISNIPYAKLPYGPTPENYQGILGALEATNIVDIKQIVLNGEKEIIEERIEANQPFRKELFADSELSVLRRVASQLGGKNGAQLSRISHEETFFSKIDIGREIPYKLAGSLKLNLK
ncbi:MAG: type II toxin-antitoxin system antitoxin SocA domain-containing protein [Pseudomonadota bacterium]